jgi:HlyD family secretion protein
MKKVVVGALILVIACVGIFLAVKNGSQERKFKTGRVRLGDVRATVTATGTVNAVTTVLVGTQVSGTIEHLYVDFNSFVKKGQLLARIDPSTFEAQVEQAMANLLSAEADVEKAGAALLEARRTLERNKKLYSRDLIAKSELDTAETNEMSAQAQLKAAKARVEQSRAALKVAQTNLRYTRIVSPVEGMVISRNVDVGQTVAASFQTPTLFNIAQDLSKMQIDTSVDEADIGKVRVGQSVEFTVDAYPTKIFEGNVYEVRNAPITVQNVVTYDVIIRIRNPELILKPGMTANVSIITDRKENVLLMPNAALRFQWSDEAQGSQEHKEKKGQSVWALKDNKPKRVSVVAGIGDGMYTEIVSGGLIVNDEVIVSLLYNKDKEKRADSPPGRFLH